jgi:hypothetical protein
MASTIPRAAVLEQARAAREGTEQRISERFFRRALFVDGFDRSASSIDVAIQLADTHARPVQLNDPVVERLSLSHEVKLHARIDRKRFQLETLRVHERSRSHDTIGDAPWQDHSERVAPLVGAPLIPGMAGRVFGLLGRDAETAVLRDVLLQLAPGFIQIMAAVLDSYYEERARKPAGESTAAPAVAHIGGNQDSCYMWRRDGFILKSWADRGADPGAR